VIRTRESGAPSASRTSSPAPSTSCSKLSSTSSVSLARNRSIISSPRGTICRIDDPERRRDRREQCLLLANTSERDQPYTAFVTFEHPSGERQRQPALASAAEPENRHQSPGSRLDPRGKVDVQADQFPLAAVNHAGVQTHADAQLANPLGPAVSRERALRVDRGPHRLHGIAK
jgi:hypothetical protein